MRTLRVMWNLRGWRGCPEMKMHTDPGSRIYEAMKSVTATLALRGHKVPSVLACLLRGARMPVAQAR